MNPRALTIVALLAALFITSAAHSRALAPAEQRASLMTLLEGHHFRADRKIFDRLGPPKEMVDHLVNFATDPKLTPKIRKRAIGALRVYPGTRTEKFLTSLLYDPTLQTKAGVLMRREAMLALAVAFRGRAITALSNHRDAEDPQIREGCARALGATRSPDALPILDAWLPHEPELFVRLAVDKAQEYIRDLHRSR